MTQVTRCLGLIGWLILVAPLMAQTNPSGAPSGRLPAVQPNQTNPNTAGNQQPSFFATNPNSTGPTTAGANVPPNGQPNQAINPSLRNPNWPPNVQRQQAPYRNPPGQQQNFQRPGDMSRHATLPQNMRQQQPPRQPPRPPIQLTPEQQAEVDQVLALWETESAKVKYFNCPFTRFEYRPGFLNGSQDIAKTISKGKISFVKPDKGKFEITEMREYDLATLSHKEVTGGSFDHWVCTGDAVYSVVKKDKTIIKQEIPPDQRGQAIADGPLPFLFGAKADKLRQRYWIRVTQNTPTEIWLEVFPRRQSDAASYSRVELILDRKEFLPRGILLHSPGGENRDSYTFGEATVNSPLDRFIPFTKPRTPFGWTLKDETPNPQSASAPTGRPNSPISIPFQR